MRWAEEQAGTLAGICGAGSRATDTYHVGDERDEVAAESWMRTLLTAGCLRALGRNPIARVPSRHHPWRRK